MGYAGFPFVAIGTGLLIHFRHPGTGDGFLVMCQVFNGIGTGIWANTAPVGLMASVTHQETAVALALWGMFGSIGAAVGFAVAGAIWTNVLPPRLLSELPADQKDVFKKIYGDIEVQMSYADGTAVRKAIVDAYAAVQRYMVIAGAAFLPLMLICLIMWRNIDLAKRQAERGQTKGNVW